MSYPKATCQHECPQAVAANERADRWQARHDGLAARLARVEELAHTLETERPSSGAWRGAYRNNASRLRAALGDA